MGKKKETKEKKEKKEKPQPTMGKKKETKEKPQTSQLDDFLFFYMPDTIHGELCQWFPASFSVTKKEIAALIGGNCEDDEDIWFNCAEQFMMYCKAGRFHDTERQKRIMDTDSPKEQKRLGRETLGFTAESWDLVKSDVVVAGNIAKFGQNPKLRGKLMGTGNRTLVEAASRDRVWGIGYTEKHAMFHRQHWGENRLGKALMVVRETLRTTKTSN